MKTTQTTKTSTRVFCGRLAKAHKLAKRLEVVIPKPKPKKCSPETPCCTKKCSACLERAQEAGR